MKPRVYIETSIPSFYDEFRVEPKMVARRQWTREWWAEAYDNYQLVTSVAVLDELGRGDYASQDQCLALLDEVPLLPFEEAIAEIVEA